MILTYPKQKLIRTNPTPLVLVCNEDEIRRTPAYSRVLSYTCPTFLRKTQDRVNHLKKEIVIFKRLIAGRMDVQSIKIDLIHWLTELQDKSVLKKLQVLKEEEESTYELSGEQKRELDTRLERYEKGEMNFSSWDTVKGKIRKRAKDAL